MGAKRPVSNKVEAMGGLLNAPPLCRPTHFEQPQQIVRDPQQQLCPLGQTHVKDMKSLLWDLSPQPPAY